MSFLFKHSRALSPNVLSFKGNVITDYNESAIIAFYCIHCQLSFVIKTFFDGKASSKVRSRFEGTFQQFK